MSPARPVIDLRSRDWRTQLMAALDAAFPEPEPKSFDDLLRRIK